MTGKVTIITERGFGFVRSDEDDRSYFFHRSGFVKGSFDDIQVGDTLVFEPKESPKGRRAEQIVVEQIPVG